MSLSSGEGYPVKKLLSLLLVFGFVASIGCGGNTSSSGKQTTTATTETKTKDNKTNP